MIGKGDRVKVYNRSLDGRRDQIPESTKEGKLLK